MWPFVIESLETFDPNVRFVLVLGLITRGLRRTAFLNLTVAGDYYYFQLRTAAFEAYCAIWFRRSNFRYQASPRESTQRRKVELWARNAQEFCLNADLHITFWGSFTWRKATTWDQRLYFHSEGRRAEDFFRPKNPTASAGCEPANLGTTCQHATSRLPKPLSLRWMVSFTLRPHYRR